MSLTSRIELQVTGQLVGAGDLGNPDQNFSDSLLHVLASGTGANQADRVFTDQRTLTASATENLDLAGVLLDAFGAAITFATIKAVIIKAASGNTNDVQLTRPASNGVPLFLAASDGIPIKPGGMFVWTAPGTGITVTAGTGDILTVTNSAGGTSVTYDVIIIGTSA